MQRGQLIAFEAARGDRVQQGQRERGAAGQCVQRRRPLLGRESIEAVHERPGDRGRVETGQQIDGLQPECLVIEQSQEDRQRGAVLRAAEDGESMLA